VKGRTRRSAGAILPDQPRLYTRAMDDEAFMQEALALARAAADAGEIPVGAVVVHHPPGGTPQVIGRGSNRREADADPTAHAEIVAIRAAGRALGAWRLADCTLYVTLEPCPMCAGAIVNARLPRLVYGCPDPKAGAVATLYRLCTDERLNHRLEVVAAVGAAESSGLLRSFFAARRGLP
jgi:tRNA(adenine34) deaminase